MTIYRYKMTYDRYPAFSREYEVKCSNSLYDLHRYIQNDIDFDEAQLAVFHACNDAWEELRSHALFDMGDGAMDSITIEKLVETSIEQLRYVFDIYNNRSFRIQLIGEVDPTRLASYPRVVDVKGDAPDQLVETEPMETLSFFESTGKPDPDEEDFDDEENDDEDDEDDVEEELFVEEEL